MSIKEIERLKGNPSLVEAYRIGMNSLFTAGITDALRALGRPIRRKEGADAIQMASEASWSAGWNDCLENLLYFQELHLGGTLETPNVKMDFGSLQKALQSGDLTQEEADAIRSGKPITYKPESVTSNITIPVRDKNGV